jgi:long-chain acyl-CoA synthetase
MSHSSTKPAWLAFYPGDVDPERDVAFSCVMDAWDALLARRGESDLVHYFDGSLTVTDVDVASDALAWAFDDRGVQTGDRIGIYLQNVPQYLIALIGIWKAGAIAVPINPMYRKGELRRLVDDCRPDVIILAHADVAETTDTLEGSSATWLIGTSDREYQTRNDPRAAWTAPVAKRTADDFGHLLACHIGEPYGAARVAPASPALICYTSGTTGPSKGAVNTHANVLHAATNFGTWVGLQPDDVVLAIAPLFHITGITLNAMTAVLNDCSLAMVGRFQAEVVLDAFAEHGVTFTIGSITAFNSLMALEWASASHFATTKALYSGGAPIPPATLEVFQERFGRYIHNVWGMTETTGGGIAVPRGAQARIDSATGTLSVGVPTQGATVRIVDEGGSTVEPGMAGELEFTAPQVIPGYWENPEATAKTLPGGHLRTGDVAVMDEDGWIYLVDRLKDQINTSGYKVWPREVEDVLYTHAEVFEVAVVGQPDAYRGEAVVAYVSVTPGASVTRDELIAFARVHLAAYKVPREIHLVADIPKTATGKIRRQEFRS